MNNEVAIAAAVILHLVSWLYGAGVQYMFHRWPTSRRYTYFTVIVGVAMTGVAYAFVAGLETAVILAAFFAASGLPVSITSMVAHTMHDEEEENKDRLLQILKKNPGLTEIIAELTDNGSLAERAS